MPQDYDDGGDDDNEGRYGPEPPECPKCGHHWHDVVSEDDVSQTLRCGECGETFQVRGHPINSGKRERRDEDEIPF